MKECKPGTYGSKFSSKDAYPIYAIFSSAISETSIDNFKDENAELLEQNKIIPS